MPLQTNRSTHRRRRNTASRHVSYAWFSCGKSRIQAGDHVVKIEGQAIHTWSQMTTQVREHPQKPLQVEILREGKRTSLTVTPTSEKVTVNGQTLEVGKIGISGPGRSFMRSNNPA